MTKEQIERLFKLNPEHPVLVTDYISEVAAALPRLLEEREKLLEALLRIQAEDGVAQHAADAIDFAEEAAP